MKRKVALDILAMQIARRNRGDSTAADYLTSLGMNKAAAAGTPQSDAESAQEENRLSAQTTSPERIRDKFSFQFFTLSKQEERGEENKSTSHHLSGPGFHKDDDLSTSSFAKKTELEPLLPLLTRIQLALKQQRAGHKLAIPPLVKKMARQQVATTLPKLTQANDPRKLYIYLDTGTNTSGLSADIFKLAQALAKSYPHCQSKLIVLPEGPQGHWAYLGNKRPQKKPLVVPKTGDSCLIITGLSAESEEQWQFLLAHLNHRGITPCWLSTSYSQVPGKYLPWGKRSNTSLPLQKPLLLLTALLSTSRIITGGMLRQVVQYLGLASGYETAFWQQPEVSYDAGSDTGYTSKPTEELIQEIRQLNTEQLQQVSAIIERHLSPIASTPLHEHRIHLALAAPAWQHPELPASYDFFSRLGVSLQERDLNSHNIAQYLAGTTQQYADLLNQADSRLQNILAQACAHNYRQNQKHVIPPAIAPQVQELLSQTQAKPCLIDVYQHGNQIILQQNETAPSRMPLLAQIKHMAGAPLLLHPKNNPQDTQTLTATSKQSINTQQAHILKGSLAQAIITPQQSKNFYWAKSLSITSSGVVASTDYIKVSWPNELASSRQEHKINRDAYSSASIEVLDHAPQWLIKNPPQLDRYGLFVELTIITDRGIENKKLKLRYIPSGSFLMGSPPTEEGRADNETQHPVTITQGYWLAETAVSQKLWRNVMGRPPEYAQGEHQDLPVVGINWAECQQFIQKLNKFKPDVYFSLPSEAQWEYACRAGTQTAFSTGESLNRQTANFHAPNQEQNQPSNSTLAVNALIPNPWGLKQMHGNIAEWCLDGYREYQNSAVVDPKAPQNTQSAAIRGGSCFTPSQDCRSAARAQLMHGNSSDFVGFRLALLDPDNNNQASS